jgi:hypothetical protein
MTSGLGTGNTLIAEAFRSALRHQLFIVAGIFALPWLIRLVAAGSADALAASGSALAVRRLTRGPASRRQVPVLHMPVAYGSSG